MTLVQRDRDDEEQRMPFDQLQDQPAAPAAPAQRAPGSNVAATIVVVGILVVLYLPVFAHAVTVWTSDEEFSFGLFVPPIALCIVWLRRDTLRRALGVGSDSGLLALAGGFVLLLVSARSGIHAIAGASFALTALGAAAYLYGLAVARVMFFPVAFLTIGLCLYRGLLASVGFGLQGLTARYAAAAASLVGVPVRRAGVDLFAGKFHFVVAEACSGLSSLLALLCLGMLIVGFVQTSLPRRLFLIALIVPIVLIANVARVTLVLALAQIYGLAVAQGFIHGFFSAALFLAALGLFYLTGSVLGCFSPIGATA